MMRRFFPSTIRQVDEALPFVFQINTTNTSTGSSTNTQFKLPLLINGIYDFDVDWGDSTTDNITVWDQAETTHTYGSTGTYTITITGTLFRFEFRNTGDRLKITDISQWGIVEFANNNNANFGAFYGCSNFNFTATDSPILQGDMAGMFWLCTSMTGTPEMNNWNVSNCTVFVNTFQQCTNFNRDISSWDVSNVTNFQAMFRQCTNFNQNIGAWNVGSGITFSAMFLSSGFNNGGSPDINDWDVSSAIIFSTQNLGMFGACPFNQPIGNWDVSNVTQFREMFISNSAFRQDLGNWKLESVINMLNFMLIKNPTTFPAVFLDAIYNGWTNSITNPSISISFSTAKYTAASIEGRALLTRANSTVTVTNAVNNGSGLIRITTGAAHGRSTGEKIFISGIVGTTEANGAWIVTVIDATTVDLQGSTFTNTYVSGGTFRIGYGWSITDGGI